MKFSKIALTLFFTLTCGLVHAQSPEPKNQTPQYFLSDVLNEWASSTTCGLNQSADGSYTAQTLEQCWRSGRTYAESERFFLCTKDFGINFCHGDPSVDLSNILKVRYGRNIPSSALTPNLTTETLAEWLPATL